MFDRIRQIFPEIVPAGARFVSVRVVAERNEHLAVRRGNVEPVQTSEDAGAMVTVVTGHGMGYAATPDLTKSGLELAVKKAKAWAERTSGRHVFDPASIKLPQPRGEYVTPTLEPWTSVSLADKLDLLKRACAALRVDDRIVEDSASLWYTDTESLYLTTDRGDAYQRLYRIAPFMSAVANHGAETQVRTLGGRGLARQGGYELVHALRMPERAVEIGNDAITLLGAPNCPTGKLDLVLEPDQMILQIHESIGHPLEIDRILGDERNYAGTSFIKVEDFGVRRYGSDLLNVTFDPTIPEEFASYGFDDEGAVAERQFIIKDGILMRGLGSVISQTRSGVAGVANARACSWNRPPIDRMANLNLEPGDASMEELIGEVADGVLMRTNCSWSIDDSRNKFQFGCEWGRRIKDGELKEVVKNCNYRGISESFWKSLARVGSRSTMQVLGTPFCGKGEPNQIIRVGHASPAARFQAVDVFGGEG